MTLLLAHGALNTSELSPLVERCVDQLLDAIEVSATDGTSLSALDVFRIRAGKFAATRLPPALYRNPQALAALRADIEQLGRVFLGQAGDAGSRFLSSHRRDQRS